MSTRATSEQVFKSGFSFLSVSLAIGIISFLLFSVALNSNNMISALFFAGIAALYLLIGIIGLISKLMTDGITMGLENGKMYPSMSKINPMDFQETFRSGLDLFGMVCLIMLATIVPLGISLSSETQSARLLFLSISVIALLSGLLGILVKIVGDSISHAITTSGYGALLHQVGVREVSEHKEENYVASVSYSSEPEWTDSDGHKWKKLADELYWWNGSGWQKHG